MNKNQKIEEEIDFKGLIKNPIRLFGWFFPYFFILMLVLGIYFVKKLPAVSLNDQPVGLIDSTLLKTDVPLKKGGLMPAVDLALVMKPDEAFISKGKELYDANCQSCHGANGLGDGTAGAMLNPKPRNFHDKEGWTNGRSFDMLYKTLQEGIIKNGMAAYEYLSPADRFAIILYLRTFAEYPEIKESEITSLDAEYKLSAGTLVPNTIPVSIAMEKLTSEFKIKEETFNSFREKVYQSEEQIAVLVQSLISDEQKVITTILNSDFASPDAFVETIGKNPISYGFTVKVLHLSKDDLRIAFDFLKKALS
ncbi:MAG: cytochrome c [Melioribacteraceae bacterium]|jgi:mono/diheme cytochrome c family protein|nr:cytochrome c [Melioribacteraceae bacterium]